MRDLFKNKSVLITGGTGSFGSKMMETLVKKFKPKKIIIFSRDELKQSQLQEKFPKEKYKNFMIDLHCKDVQSSLYNIYFLHRRLISAFVLMFMTYYPYF